MLSSGADRSALAAEASSLTVRNLRASGRIRLVGMREDDEAQLTPKQLAALRGRYVAAIREHHAEGRPARRWPLRFLVRRTAQHAMDHAWEMEDRDPPGGAA